MSSSRAKGSRYTLMSYSLLFHSNNGHANAPHGYVIRTSFVFFDVQVVNQLDALISHFLNKTTCFGQFFCPSSGVCHRTHSNGICRTEISQVARITGVYIRVHCSGNCLLLWIYGWALCLSDRASSW